MNTEQNTDKRNFDLEDRLINFAIRISEVVDALPNTALGKYLKGQMIRSGTSPALNYGEAQSAESSKDFIHKLKIVLKELRETLVGLKIIKRKPLIEPSNKLNPIIKENNELISIFVKSIDTAKKNLNKKKQ
ncbi:MAG: four helix bundle protein [Bacteroidales bacterium]|nr:four helix bundle protein [Bacteroidales bacterium]